MLSKAPPLIVPPNDPAALRTGGPPAARIQPLTRDRDPHA